MLAASGSTSLSTQRAHLLGISIGHGVQVLLVPLPRLGDGVADDYPADAGWLRLSVVAVVAGGLAGEPQASSWCGR
jgi:hypothetical protein